MHCSQHLLPFPKKAMEFGDGVAIVASETKVYRVQFLSVVSVRVSKKNVFWLNAAVDDISRMQILENIELRESSESY